MLENTNDNDFSTYLAFCLKNYSKFFKYEYQDSPENLPNIDETYINEALENLKDLQWLVYFESEPAFPNPKTMIEIAKEVSIKITEENIQKNILDFLKKEKIDAYSPIRDAMCKKYPELHLEIFDFENAIVDLHKNIQRINYDNDQAYLISSIPVPEVIAKCLFELTFTNKFRHKLRPDPGDAEEYNDEQDWFKYYKNL